MERFERNINTNGLTANIIGKRPRSIPVVWWELHIYAQELMRKRAENDGKAGNRNRDL